jgi:hypothetical protein
VLTNKYSLMKDTPYFERIILFSEMTGIHWINKPCFEVLCYS